MTKQNNLFTATSLLLTILLFCSANSNKPEKEEPPVFTASMGEWHRSDDGYHADVKIVLANSTRDTFEFAMWSCYEYNLNCSTNSNTIQVWQGDCLRNIPEIVKVWPHDSIISKTTVTCDSSTKNQDSVFRVTVLLNPATHVRINDRKRRKLAKEFIRQEYLPPATDAANLRQSVLDLFSFGLGDYQLLDTSIAVIRIWSNPIDVHKIE